MSALETFIPHEDAAAVCIICGKLKFYQSGGGWGYVLGEREPFCRHRWRKLPDEDKEAIQKIAEKHIEVKKG